MGAVDCGPDDTCMLAISLVFECDTTLSDILVFVTHVTVPESD